jgi:hypothetical protein
MNLSRPPGPYVSKSATNSPVNPVLSCFRAWVVERLLAWINCNRRLAKDVEATTRSAAALYAASMLMIRRIARFS